MLTFILFNTRSKEKFPPTAPAKLRLDGGLVWDGGNGLGKVVLGADGALLTGLDGLPLQVNVGALFPGLALLLGVGLDTVDELGSALGVVDVLDANVHTLLDKAVADLLVDDDTEGGLGDVVDDTGLSVVDLVGHTAVEEIKSAVLFIRWE